MSENARENYEIALAGYVYDMANNHRLCIAGSRLKLDAALEALIGSGTDAASVSPESPSETVELQVKRYDLITNYRCGSAIEEMEPSDDGDWVRYTDVVAALLAHGQATRHAEPETVVQERDEARKVVRDTLWMAGRYADGRRSYAVGLYNDALAIAERSGYAEGAKPARDGMFDAEPETPAQCWQPIETAPKDGKMVLLCKDGRYIQGGAWNRGGAMCMPHWMTPGDLFKPTHWMPLPPPPVQAPSVAAEGERRT